jgi:hypothetical protein
MVVLSRVGDPGDRLATTLGAPWPARQHPLVAKSPTCWLGPPHLEHVLLTNRRAPAEPAQALTSVILASGAPLKSVAPG